jgi:hypothetical protein
MSKRHRTKARRPSRKVTVQNTAKGLTSQAGLIPVVKFLDKFGTRQLIAQTVPLERGDSAVYDVVDGVMLTLVALIGGARSLSGIVAVWSDQVLRKVSGWCRIPDDSTLGRLLKSLRDVHIVQLESVNHHLRGRIWKYGWRAGRILPVLRRRMWVDGDSTVKTVYGRPEGAAKGYNPGKRGALSYHPLLAFCAETKEILQGWMRCGNAYTSNGTVEFLKQLLAHLPNQVRIVFRADSGFFSGALLEFLEARAHGYLIKVKLKGLVALLQKQTWTAVAKQPGWEQCEFDHACENWSRARRFVAVRVEKKEQGPKPQGELFDHKDYDYFCYVVSEDWTPWQAHKKYGARATSETWIDEAKNQMGLAHLKTDTFLANAALFQCAILAYNTVRWMGLCSGDGVLRRWEIQTVRTFLVRVAGKLLEASRQLRIKAPESHLYPTQWQAWVDVGLT